MILLLLALHLPGMNSGEFSANPIDMKVVAAAKPELTKAERDVLDLTNAERSKEKLAAFKPKPVLMRVAREHSANMARKGELKHELDGTTPATRVRDSGYRFRSMAENIASGISLSPKDALKLWMDSELHKANIMHGELAEIGIGIALSEAGDVYYTQVFATPSK